MRQTKALEILKYIRDNQPCRAKDICEGVNLELRHIPKDRWNSGPQDYYVGWSGQRVNLTSWSEYDPREPRIKLVDRKYRLTEAGRKYIKAHS